MMNSSCERNALMLAMGLLSSCSLLDQCDSRSNVPGASVSIDSSLSSHEKVANNAEPSSDDLAIGADTIETEGLRESWSLLDDSRTEDDLAKAIDVYPANCHARYEMARLHALEGSFDDASSELGNAMKSCFPYFRDLYSDSDFEKLRESEHYETIKQLRAQYSSAWARALSDPGVFIIVGVRWRTESFDTVSRGALYYYHQRSGRFLALGAGVRTAGMVMDRDKRLLYVISIDPLSASNVDNEAQLRRLTLQEYVFEDVFRETTQSLGHFTAASFYLTDGKLEKKGAFLNPYTHREEWLWDEKADLTPERSSSDNDGEWQSQMASFCNKRGKVLSPVEQSFAFERLCGDTYPPVAPGVPAPAAGDPWCAPLPDGTFLCSKPASPSASTELQIIDRKGEATTLATVDSVIQMITNNPH